LWRRQVTLQANVGNTIRADAVFIPYPWTDKKSANLLTNPALNPVSKIPEFKARACRLSKYMNV
jgi:assimilatory nitrate reductase catalytic subunit